MAKNKFIDYLVIKNIGEIGSGVHKYGNKVSQLVYTYVFLWLGATIKKKVRYDLKRTHVAS